MSNRMTSEQTHKALTICQPYAHLIATGRKRVENRTWPTYYRGPLLIHAGKSRDWMSDDGVTEFEYDIPVKEMAFGAIVAVADLTGCVPYDAAIDGAYTVQWPWLRKHEHTNGPWCWILENVRRLPEPIPARGAQGLFELKVAI